jgi:protein phosphatase
MSDRPVLRIAEQWVATDLGRRRQGNEDAVFARAPLFAVADGMGGAQAGEVASDIAVRTLDADLARGRPADALVSVIEEANRRIHERSRTDAGLAGMGTTITAAYVDESAVVLAHVGDSRAYLLRSGRLTRLTKDHSLVGELVERGKLTEEQAEAHPQRSVITRALGPEPSVEVDVDVFPARPGDVFLLCSDGLTDMISEQQLAPILTEARTLERAGRALIAAANEAGGRDNISVVLFRLEAVEAGRGGRAPAGAQAATREHPALRGEEATPAEPRRAVHEVTDGAPRSATATAVRPVRAPAGARAPAPLEPRDERRAPRRHRRRRWLTALVITLAIALPVLTGAWLASRAVYFLGTTGDGRIVTIFRGLPYDLPLGIRLYERYYESGVPLSEVPAARRETFVDHKLRSRDDAENLVIALEKGQIGP